jgi:very-short-patch-repair endonuclease
MRESRAKQVFPIKDTKIEVKIQDYLNLLKISFNTHRQLNILHAYQTDIFIPSMNLVIECDGDYWHANPLKFPNPNEWQKEQIKKDKIRTKELKEKEYNILRLWESEINKMNIEEFTNILFKNHD